MLQNIPSRAPETKQRMTSLQLKLFVEFECRHHKHGKIDALFFFYCCVKSGHLSSLLQMSWVLASWGFPPQHLHPCRNKRWKGATVKEEITSCPCQILSTFIELGGRKQLCWYEPYFGPAIEVALIAVDRRARPQEDKSDWIGACNVLHIVS